jgi:site-specific recombinase XerD
MDYQITNLKARVHLDIAPATVKNYEAMKRKVQLFLQDERKTGDTLLSHLSLQFVNELDTYLRRKMKLHNNGVVKCMQQLKRVIRVAIQNEWLDKDPFGNYHCKIVEPKRVYLTKQELLQRLENLAPASERLNRVRDVFVFSCYTGLAYADVKKLSEIHIQKINCRQWIILDRTKTKNQSVVAFLPTAQAILRRYNIQPPGKLLPVIASQNLNKYLKALAIIAAIKNRLSFHAARHTFATTVT